MRRVLVTGLGAVTPLGDGAERLVDGWCAGEVPVVAGAAHCRDFDPSQSLSRKEIKRTDRFQQLALAAAAAAVDQAGWIDGPPVDPERAGCVWGTSGGGILSTMENLLVLARAGAEVSPFALPCQLQNMAPAHIALRFGLRGPANTVNVACASGTQAIIEAAQAIGRGELDVAICGGSEAALVDLAFAGFRAVGALSESGVARPFDARRDGFVMGEGAGALVLESEEVAQARGADVLGEVLGGACTDDAYHMTAPDPSGAQAGRAVREALASAGVAPEEVDYVNAHGTATALNDAAEAVALRVGMGETAAARVPISSLKSSIGHLIGAAGAVEAVATITALQRRVAPPTLAYESSEDGLGLDVVGPQARALRPEGRLVALSNSFGFGGHNAVLCLGVDAA